MIFWGVNFMCKRLENYEFSRLGWKDGRFKIEAFVRLRPPSDLWNSIIDRIFPINRCLILGRAPPELEKNKIIYFLWFSLVWDKWKRYKKSKRWEWLWSGLAYHLVKFPQRDFWADIFYKESKVRRISTIYVHPVTQISSKCGGGLYSKRFVKQLLELWRSVGDENNLGFIEIHHLALRLSINLTSLFISVHCPTSCRRAPKKKIESSAKRRREIVGVGWAIINPCS